MQKNQSSKYLVKHVMVGRFLIMHAIEFMR